jgi:urease subunit alpha
MRRSEYIAQYGPTTGDRVRLADTDLYVIVEDDHVGYGDEPLFGFGKTLRSRLLQDDRATGDSEVDFAVIGVLLIDPLVGIVKTNLGVKDGRVAGIGPINGRAAHGQDLVVGPNTYPITGYGLIATAGGVDSHVHLPSPRLVPSALAAGITTLITAGFEEPPYGMHRMLMAFENLPVNIGLQACARTAETASAESVIAAGAIGLKVHEDYGAYPELIDAALRSAEAHDIAVCLHTDGLNEAAEIDDTLAAIAGRTTHAYHVEGSAGGHLPDNLLLVTDPAVICSSTTPSIPYGRYTAAEHVDMILAVHGGNPDLPDDLLAVTERVHEATMAAEGPLHDFGAISITNSDSQGVGRMAETIRRTWQLCDAMKRWRAEDGSQWTREGRRSTRSEQVDDNRRVLQYLAKYTTEPARVHGIEHEVGTLLPGRLADIVLWRPALFGVKPELVLKNGFEAWGAMGGGNGSVERVQPVSYGPHWGATGTAGAAVGTTFVSATALDAGVARVLGSRRRLAAVRGTRGLSRTDMSANRAVPPIEVDPADGRVFLSGHRLASAPVDRVPLNRTYLVS